MRKKTLLMILLVAFVIGALTVGVKLLNSLNDNREDFIEENENVTSLSEKAHDENNDEEDTEEDQILPEQEVFSSGDVIDIIDDASIPCIYGNTDNLYEKNEIDPYNESQEYETEYYMSNYQTKFSKLIACYSEELQGEVSFQLDEKFSQLEFTMGLWESANDNSCMVIIYKGDQQQKKSILKAKIHPCEKPKSFQVDVADCSVITIKAIAIGDTMQSFFVTDGFKLTYK